MLIHAIESDSIDSTKNRERQGGRDQLIAYYLILNW